MTNLEYKINFACYANKKIEITNILSSAFSVKIDLLAK